MKKVILLITGLLFWVGCVKETPQQEPEKKEETEQPTEQENDVAEQLQKPVKIVVTGNQYGANKEIYFSYDSKGRIQNIKKWMKLTDPVVFEYIIDYDMEYPKVTIKQYQLGSPKNSVEEVIAQGRLIETRVINYGNDFTQGDYNMNFRFETERFIEDDNNHTGYILFDENIRFSDTGSYPIQLGGQPMNKYDDKNHPFKNINVFLNPSFLDFDDCTGNWDWSGQETFLLLPIYPYEKAMKYTNNLVEYNYSKRNWNNQHINKTEKRQIVYDTADFPVEITLSDGTKYVIEYNKKNPIKETTTDKKGSKKPKRITGTDQEGVLWNEYLFHYDNKERLSKIVSRYVPKSYTYTYTYDISYQGDSNHIAEVMVLEDQIKYQYQYQYTLSYSYGKDVLFIEEKYLGWNRISKYGYGIQNIDFESELNGNPSYTTSISYDDNGNIYYVKKYDENNHIYNVVYDTKNHPFKNVGIAFQDVGHFSIFINKIVPMIFVNNPIEWTMGYNARARNTKRTNMKYDADDFLIEYQEHGSIIKIEYTE